MRLSRILLGVIALAVYFAVTMPENTTAAQKKLPKKYTETVTAKDGEKLSFEMVLIPGGSFVMGSPVDEAGRKDHEGPQHKVRLDPFYLCSKEATIKQFMAYYRETVSAKRDFIAVEEAKKDKEQKSKDDVDVITGPTPVYGDMTMGYEDTHPAIGITWHNAMTFCRWLSKKTGKKYHLPTEAEWEYACRAGTTTAYSFGDDPKKLGDFGWYEDTADSETNPVGKKKPNAWGLYDMSGNVREWVYDFYSPAAYKEAAKKTLTVNPKGPNNGELHVARGGDYSCPAEELRSAARTFEEEWWRSGDPQIPKSIWWLPEMDFIGFRVACSIETDTKK
ncbi:MAG: SUMF1/EgtB/PvdO family nonheme iron enzyme [Sedimentisphaerales bacterium]|nr:SUMF1/EgtB/PvdO family nonheme iron enzyme [Sedimentisphaerales bacterium]